MYDTDHIREILSSRRDVLEKRKVQIAQEDSEQEALESLLQQYQKQSEQLAALTAEVATLKSENEQLKMEKKELTQVSQKLVQKAEHDDLTKVLRTYMNISKRKNAKKKGYIKMVIMEMAMSAQLTLPEEMQKELENFDDDTTNDQPAVGEYVQNKYVENEIQNVESGGKGIEKHYHGI